jgi:hypothetical protein
VKIADFWDLASCSFFDVDRRYRGESWRRRQGDEFHEAVIILYEHCG